MVDKLVEEYKEIAEEVKIIGKNKDKCSSCIWYIALFPILCTIKIGITTYFVYGKYINHNKKKYF